MNRKSIAREIEFVDSVMQRRFHDYGEETHRALQEAAKLIEQEPKTGRFRDSISRDYLLSIANKDGAYGYVSAHDIINAPCYNPQKPKTGHWSIVSDGYGDKAYICECSECKDTVWVYKDADRKWNYCPNCGAKMEE